MVCVVGRMRDLILQLSKSSIYSTKPDFVRNHAARAKQEIARICGAVSAGCRCKHGFVNKSVQADGKSPAGTPVMRCRYCPTSIPVILKVVGALAPNHLPA